MTVTALTGAFGFAPQADKGTADAITDWHKASQIDLGEREITRALGQEIGGSVWSSGILKTGVFAAGGANWYPRLENSLGWILGGLMGTSSTTAHPTEASANVHTFVMASDEAALEWMTLAKVMPGSSSGEDMLLRVTDGRVAAVQFQFPPMGIVSMRTDFVGIKPEVITLSDSGLTAAPEGSDSVPITSTSGGSFEMPNGTEIYPSGCTVSFTNGLSNPETQEAVLGSYYPDDLAVLSRGAVIQFPLKVSTYDYWTQFVFNSADASALSTYTAWSPVVYESSWEYTVESADNISGLTIPYTLRLFASEVQWTVAPITLVGGDMVMLVFTGIVTDPSSGDAFRIELWNEEANYTWP